MLAAEPVCLILLIYMVLYFIIKVQQLDITFLWSLKQECEVLLKF